jgi:WD40 repeat protein
LASRDAHVQFSSDGKLLVTFPDADSSGRETPTSVKLWDSIAGKPLPAFVDSTNSWICAAFASKSGRLATGSSDGSVAIWDVTSLRQLKSWKAHTSSIDQIALSADGSRLATHGLGERTSTVWTVDTAEKLVTLSDKTADLWRPVFSPDGRFLALQTQMYPDATHETFRVVDLIVGTIAVHNGTPKETATAIAFSPDEQFLLTGEDFGTVRVWSLSGERTTGSTCPAQRQISFTPAQHLTGRILGGDQNTPGNEWLFRWAAPYPVTTVTCKQTGQWEEILTQKVDDSDSKMAICQGWINGGNAPITMTVEWNEPCASPKK